MVPGQLLAELREVGVEFGSRETNPSHKAFAEMASRTRDLLNHEGAYTPVVACSTLPLKIDHDELHPCFYLTRYLTELFTVDSTERIPPPRQINRVSCQTMPRAKTHAGNHLLDGETPV